MEVYIVEAPNIFGLNSTSLNPTFSKIFFKFFPYGNSLADFFKKHNIISKKLSENTSIRGYDYQMQKNKSTEFSKNSLVIPIFFPINPDIIYTLISTSTPLGNSSFIRASIVFDDEL